MYIICCNKKWRESCAKIQLYTSELSLQKFLKTNIYTARLYLKINLLKKSVFETLKINISLMLDILLKRSGESLYLGGKLRNGWSRCLKWSFLPLGLLLNNLGWQLTARDRSSHALLYSLIPTELNKWRSKIVFSRLTQVTL